MKYFFSFIILIFSLKGTSQSFADSITYVGFNLQDAIAEKLSNLAVNNLQTKLVSKDVAIADQEVNKSKALWLNHITVSGNLNEFSIRNTLSNSIITTPQYNFYPRYNIGLSLPLGFVKTHIAENRIARLNKEKLLDQKEKTLNDLKQQIKTQYQIYLTNRYLLAIHESTLQDDKILFERVQVQFENNQVDLEIYSVAAKKFNEQLTKKISLLRDVNTSKYLLEGLIGMDLSEALRQVSLAIMKK
jgi:outer membrane protein TolC